jgi:inositol-hexakisphosphate 5-kinase
MMDLKMGSLAYNPLKSSKQQLKIKNSTSGSVGFRISGMEVYQTLDKKIIFRNKYWGRSIKETEILRSLALFFFNGCCLRLNAISSYIKKVEDLRIILMKCPGYRFHSSSLLLVYDGMAADRLMPANSCTRKPHTVLDKRLKNRRPIKDDGAD